MNQHPHQVFIPDSKTEGVRSYREPEVAHPLQIAFLEEAGERAYVERLRALLSAGKLDEADSILGADIAGFTGRMARMCQQATIEQVAVEGWEDLLPILAEYEGPPITAITVGLTNEPDLVFDNGAEHEPMMVAALYSDDSYAFSQSPIDAVLSECLSEYPAFAGHDEDVEFYAVLAGLAPLNTALIQSKHRYFLRDGRDGVEGRAPGGYVEYILATWLRALRFLQALRAAAAAHGLPDGARLIAGTVGLHTDFACQLVDGRSVPAQSADSQATAPAPVATLTMKKWAPRPDPLAEASETGSAIRRKVAEPAAINQFPSQGAETDCGATIRSEHAPTPASSAMVAVAADGGTLTPPIESPAPEPSRGFLARLFRKVRLRR